MTLPRTARHLIGFGPHLRQHGFAVATDQLIDFLRGIACLGPESIDDVRRAAIALLGIRREREDEFNALFDAYFLGFGLARVDMVRPDDVEVEAHEPMGMQTEAIEVEDDRPAGELAAAAERLTRRQLAEPDEDSILAAFSRQAPHRLPRRKSYRHIPARRGNKIDLRRTLQKVVRSGGEAVTLVRQRRKMRQRRILLLIDVSGSMKEQTELFMGFAHALTAAANHVEVFTLGTRLTRITAALRHRNRVQALRVIGEQVADIDGGTRIGEALQAFLAVPRYLGFARGALIVVLSDGLERGGPGRMVESVRRLSGLAWRISWLSPLAAGDGFRPETEGLRAASKHLDVVGAGGSLDAVARHFLEAGRVA